MATDGKAHKKKQSLSSSPRKENMKPNANVVKPLTAREEAFLRRELGLPDPSPKRSFEELLQANDAEAVREKEKMLKAFERKRNKGRRQVTAKIISGGAVETDRRKH